jgi:hypothetical protein
MPSVPQFYTCRRPHPYDRRLQDWLDSYDAALAADVQARRYDAALAAALAADVRARAARAITDDAWNGLGRNDGTASESDSESHWRRRRERVPTQTAPTMPPGDLGRGSCIPRTPTLDQYGLWSMASTPTTNQGCVSTDLDRQSMRRRRDELHDNQARDAHHNGQRHDDQQSVPSTTAPITPIGTIPMPRTPPLDHVSRTRIHYPGTP